MNSGSAVRASSSARDVGSSRSRPWPRTSTCSPAESRPRTSSRSSADSATWIDVERLDAPRPTASAPARSRDRRARCAAGRGGPPTPRPCTRSSAALTRLELGGADRAPRPSSSVASIASSCAPQRVDAVLERERGRPDRRAGPATPGTPRSARVDRLDDRARPRRAASDESAASRARGRERGRRRASSDAAPSASGRRASRAAPDDADDPAHDGEIYGRSGVGSATPTCSTSADAGGRPPPRPLRRSAPRPSPAPAARCPTAARAPGRRRRARPRRRAPRLQNTRVATSSVGARRRRRCAAPAGAGSSPPPAPTAAGRGGAMTSSRRIPVSMPSPVVAWSREDHVARLLAAEHEVALARARRARCGRRPASRRRSMPCGVERAAQAEVRHHRDRRSASPRSSPRSCRSMRGDRDDLVAVDELAAARRPRSRGRRRRRTPGRASAPCVDAPPAAAPAGGSSRSRR